MTSAGRSRFRDKVVLVTGATAGIGRVTAELFAAEGANVVFAGRRAEEGAAVEAGIRQRGGSAHFIAADMTRLDDIERMIDTVVGTYGGLDFAFNNAGMEGSPFVPTADYDDGVFRDVIDLNLTGVFRCMKREIALMVDRGAGAIVNTVSGAGLRAYPFGAGYTASKWGVVGMTQAAALEYAPKQVRINAVCPGVIMTAMAERSYIHDGVFDPAIVESHPMGRIGTCEEVARAVLWLCSDEASFITGIVMPIDGGAILS